MEITSESKLLLFIQILLLSTPIQSTNYVKSNNSSLHDFPGLCLTLDEYINESMRYFTTGSIFVFLPGNHSQRNALNISNISGMIWRGNDSGSNDVIILSSSSLLSYNVTNFTIEGLNFVRSTNVPILAFTRSAILLSSLVFQSNMETTERAVQLNHSNITIINTSFERIRGGAVMATDHSTLTLIDTAFIGNEVPEGPKSNGGAIYCANSTIKIGNNSINNNRAYWKGGAIYCQDTTINMTGNNVINNNLATMRGGAIYCRYSTITMTGNNSINNNRAKSSGGAIYCAISTMTMTGNNFFNNNNATREGGAVRIWRGSIIITGIANFSQNEASTGGALYLSKSLALIKGTDTNFINNNGVNSTYNTVTFNGSMNYSNHQGSVSKDSSIEFTLFYNNNALTSGGAISSEGGNLSFRGSTSFISNKAQIDGGALYAFKTEVEFCGTANFSSNAAQSGGAMYFTSGATLFLASILNVSHNNATDYGGAIFHRDIVTPIQCNERIRKENEYKEFPNCFLQFDGKTEKAKVAIYSYHNSAGKGGNLLYGGLLGMCWFIIRSLNNDSSPYNTLLSKGYIQILSQDNTSSTEEIESEPLQLCFCYNNLFHHDCSNMKNIEIQRGQELDVSLVAIGQGWSIVPTDITALGKKIRFKHNQTLQNTSRQCSSLQYSLYSNSDHGKLVLYPNGPCRDTGLAKAVVQVTFLPCPDGFR